MLKYGARSQRASTIVNEREVEVDVDIADDGRFAHDIELMGLTRRKVEIRKKFLRRNGP